ncbi:oncoprotein-induced transcript 3 protein-like [Montipora capricornis]|uniref:oncoprotein-induced transcript 3 protein-like n=1 Tax=Montipora capricornis TaxID=246305 RepID=UPI0035F11313
MASKMKILLVTWLLVFILVEESKPVLARKGGKLKQLQKRVTELEKQIAKEDECKACSLIEELFQRVEALENRTQPPPTTAPPLPEECKNYQTLSDGFRKVTTSVSSPVQCDNNLKPNWYRFVGAAGSKMPTSCVPANKCGSHATGWLSGDHPTVQEGIVTRKVCFSYWSCCNWSINIQVRNCGDFYIYKINSTPSEHPCHLVYCGTD